MPLFLFPIENSQRANYFLVTSLGIGGFLLFVLGGVVVFFKESFQVQNELSASLCELVSLT